MDEIHPIVLRTIIGVLSNMVHSVGMLLLPPSQAVDTLRPTLRTMIVVLSNMVHSVGKLPPSQAVDKPLIYYAQHRYDNINPNSNI